VSDNDYRLEACADPLTIGGPSGEAISMAKCVELEIGLHHRDAESYTAELRARQPDSETDPLSGESRRVQFDFTRLRELQSDPAAYGECLSSSLFAEAELLADFEQARAVAQSLACPLRIRLLIGISAPELQQLYWETLVDPRDHTPLLAGENILFSRYLLGSADWRPVGPRSKGDFKALIAIANPSNLDYYNLAAINVAAELARAQKSLGGIPTQVLPEAESRHVTLDNLIDSLRPGDIDIVYLACHGAFQKDEPWLWLEDEAGKAVKVSGKDLVTQVKGLSQRPLLIVLASCESAGKGTGYALSALGPRLAGAGIPAVVAMQGQISMSTVDTFMPAFFAALREDGQIDRAVALARNAVRGRPDHWMPVLYMRLRDGNLWFKPGFSDEKDFKKWPDLLSSIKLGKCTPIVGLGLSEPLLGSMRDIALNWAETHQYPMAPHERESLPQVAQFVQVEQSPAFVRAQLGEYAHQEILRRHGSDVPPELREDSATLEQLIEAVWAKRWERDPAEPYKILAQLPVPIYITANWHDLLYRALIDAGKQPRTVICPWNRRLAEEQAEQMESDFTPTKDHPLIYHLFGRLDDPRSLVIAEDDYFNFLIGATRDRKLIPTAVRRQLADSALLFVGFQLNDWNFRVLLRVLAALEGGARSEDYTHIAAQIAPEEGAILEPQRARKYLQDYFAKAAVSIYWGNADDFLKELSRQMSDLSR
jgi:hypothetical protein